MTISSTTNRKEYVGDNSTVEFSFPYYFLADADLKVYNAGTLQTITTHYTVSGAGNPAGGTVTFVTAPVTDAEVVILRDPWITQTSDWVENDPDSAAVKEQAFDKLTMICQRLADRLDRAMIIADDVVSTTISTELPSASDGSALGWSIISGVASIVNLDSADVYIPIQASAPDEATYKLWYDSTNSMLKYWGGASWLSIEDAASLSAAQTFTGVNTFEDEPIVSTTSARVYLRDSDGTVGEKVAAIQWNADAFQLNTYDDTYGYDNNLLNIEGDQSNATLFGSKIWTAGNDGTGSTLDADTVDGVQASRLATHDHANGTDTTVQVVGDTTYIKASTYFIRSPSGAGKFLRCVAYVSANVYEDASATATAHIRPGYVNSSDVETETGSEYEFRIVNTGGAGDMAVTVAIPFDLSSTQVNSNGDWKLFIMAKAGSTSDNIDIDAVTVVMQELYE